MNDVPPICVDLRLAAFVESPFGVAVKYGSRKHLREIDKMHKELHKKYTNHIHLDSTEDFCLGC